MCLTLIGRFICTCKFVLIEIYLGFHRILRNVSHFDCSIYRPPTCPKILNCPKFCMLYFFVLICPNLDWKVLNCPNFSCLEKLKALFWLYMMYSFVPFFAFKKFYFLYYFICYVTFFDRVDDDLESLEKLLILEKSGFLNVLSPISF